MSARPASASSLVAIIGGGPAGLMAAEVLANAGVRVELFDAMPSVGRKFLLAGVGGMNITHSEAKAPFLARYREREGEIAALLADFDAEALRAWIHDLGINTFVGTSGRVFPTDMKAAPLLRAWLHRLRAAGLVLHARHRWTGQLEAAQGGGWTLGFDTPQGPRANTHDAVVLALGGASWARLGSDGAWQPWLAAQGVDVIDHAINPLHQLADFRFIAEGGDRADHPILAFDRHHVAQQQPPVTADLLILARNARF